MATGLGSRLGSRHRGLILAFAGVAVTALLGSLSWAKLSTNDVWIHLKTGELALESFSVPQKDPYSFTAADHDYLAHEWLSGVVFYVLYRAFGIGGLIFTKFAVPFLTTCALSLVCLRHRDRLSVFLPVFGLMSYTAAARFLERPHIFSFLFLSIYLFLFFQYRDGGRKRGWLLAILPFQVLWANMHGGFVLGVLLLAVFAAGEAAAAMRATYFGRGPRAVVARGDLALLAGLPFLALAVSLINPYGFRLLEFPFRLTGMEVFMQDVFEWRSPFDNDYDISFAFFGYWVWVTVLFGSFFFLPQDRPGEGPRRSVLRALNAALFVALLVFSYAFMWRQELLVGWPAWWVALGVLFCIVNLRRLDLTEVAVVALMFGLSMRHNRGVTDAVIATFPILTHNLSRIAAGLQQLPAGRLANGLRVGLSLLLLAEAAHVQLFGYRYRLHVVREGGFGIASTMPVCAVDYIVRRGFSGNAYSSYGDAALLIFRRHPEVKVAMDSRNDVYGPALYAEYKAVKGSPQAMRAYLKKYPVDFFLVTHGDFAVQVTDFLLDSGWALVFFDDRDIVLVKDTPQFAPLIAEDAYRRILPDSSRWQLPVGGDDAEAFLVESVRASESCPTAWGPWWFPSPGVGGPRPPGGSAAGESQRRGAEPPRLVRLGRPGCASCQPGGPAPGDRGLREGVGAEARLPGRARRPGPASRNVTRLQGGPCGRSGFCEDGIMIRPTAREDELSKPAIPHKGRQVAAEQADREGLRCRPSQCGVLPLCKRTNCPLLAQPR